MNHLSSRSARRASLVLLALATGLLVWAPTAVQAASTSKVVRYHGYRLVVPSSWPVYNLHSHPTACVRFDRHAVYLGRPSASQSCPAHSAGRTEAILVSPLASGAARGGQLLPAPTTAGALPAQGSAAQLTRPAQGVAITATWNRHQSVIRRAVGVHSLPGASAAAHVPARR
jgi:hypothetical protein